MATVTTRPQLETAPPKAPRRSLTGFWAVLAVLAVAALAVVAFTVWPFAPEGEVSLDRASPYYWEEIGQEALARTAVAVETDTFYVDGLEVRAAEARAAGFAESQEPAGYYWEEITRQALERTAPTPAERILEDLSG